MCIRDSTHTGGLQINNVIKRSETNQLLQVSMIRSSIILRIAAASTPSLQELVGKYTHIENYFMREGLTKVNIA